jgi:putative CocE/NonD family hydrolase
MSRPTPHFLAAFPAAAARLLLAALGAAFALRATAAEVERNVAVPMRDGVVLRADIHRPDGPGPHPVLVLRTPYGKHGGRPIEAYTKAGYIVIKQDARGRYASEGKYESLYTFGRNDASDGYDTVEWAARLSGGNGKVGTFGISYDAFLQWRLAALRPPSLVAMAASSIPPRLTDIEGPGTIRPGRRLDWYYCGMSPDMRLRSGRPGPKTKEEARVLWNLGMEERLLYFLPWLELPYYVFEDDTGDMQEWLRHPEVDPWNLLAGCRDIAAPNINFVGWFDHCNDSIELFQGMRRDGRGEVARSGQRLIIGPWSHASLGRRKQGDLDFGPDAEVSIEGAQVQWFDRWMKGRADSTSGAPVRIFVMGANRWRDEQEWPLARATSRELFLRSGGRANTPHGDGVLAPRAPSAAGADRYVYDPRVPVPTLWTATKFTVPADQRPLADRDDILVYQTEPLVEPVEVTGYPEVVLHVAASTPDTDFFARLIDVAPDGVARDVAMGMVRARYRNGLQAPELLTPDKVTEIRIRLRPTANEFQARHRIRLDVTSSDFPNYDRNHNTAANQNADAQLMPAKITLHHGGNKPSRLILPVVASSGARTAGKPAPPARP